MRLATLLSLILLAGCNARPGRNATNSGGMLDGYSRILIQPPMRDPLAVNARITERIEQRGFETAPAGSLATLSAEEIERSMVFTYQYIAEPGTASIWGMFTDAKTGQVIHQWQSNSMSGEKKIDKVASCLDDGLKFFEIRTGFNPAAIKARPVSW